MLLDYETFVGILLAGGFVAVVLGVSALAGPAWAAIVGGSIAMWAGWQGTQE